LNKKRKGAPSRRGLAFLLLLLAYGRECPLNFIQIRIKKERQRERRQRPSSLP